MDRKFVMVPKHPTPAMREAGASAGIGWDFAHECWNRMIRVAEAEAAENRKELLAAVGEAIEQSKGGPVGLMADGSPVFINRGEDYDSSDLNCPHCGGSGHKDDVTPPVDAQPVAVPEACKALLREVMHNHRDKESPDYNACEDAQCMWCEEAAVFIAQPDAAPSPVPAAVGDDDDLMEAAGPTMKYDGNGMWFGTTADYVAALRAVARPAPADAEPGPMARCTCAASGPDYCEVHAS